MFWQSDSISFSKVVRTKKFSRNQESLGLSLLLDKAGLGDEDEIIAVGDILDRGPESREVFQFFRDTPNARSIRGNIEQEHMLAAAGDIPPRPSVLMTRWQVDEAYGDVLAWIKSLPLYLDLPGALLVHGYLEPGLPLLEQKPDVLLGMSDGEAYLKRQYARPWYEYYANEKPLIVGHRDYTQMQKVFVYEDRVWGIDTRCVYGGALTGVLLPEFKLISVPARRNHLA